MGTEAEKNQVRESGTEKRKLRTHCYYSDYVGHMIRFFLTTPETIQVHGKRSADIQNWIAVQDIWHKLGAEDKQVLETIYKTHRVSEGVRNYCKESGADEYKTWVLVTKTNQAIAKRRGLI